VRLVRILGRVVLAIAAIAGALLLGARFMDGPLDAIPGGPLRSGLLVSLPVQDWSFAAEVETIEMQLLADGRSRTVWILVDSGRAFIPCAIGAPPGKTWHLKAEQDGRGVLRIEGRRYPVTLSRVSNPGIEGALEATTSDKYPSPPGAGGENWYFGLTSR
jgi:hypothetical protein